MELRHLRYFVAVLDEQNFTRAAERLRIAQPGISAQIRQLEREVGEPLLDRTGRSIRLTAAGAAFLPYARAALDAAASGVAAVEALTGLVGGRLHLGTVATISSTAFDLATVLARFHTDHLGVDIDLLEGATADLVAGVMDGQLDAALVGLGHLRLPDEIATVRLVSERLVAVRPASVSRARSIRIADLAEHDLVVPREGTGLRARLDTAFAAAGLRPRIVFESGDPKLLIDLAGAGLGTAIVPASVIARHRLPELAVVALTPRIDGQIGLAWHRERPSSPAARAFIAHVRSQAPS